MRKTKFNSFIINLSIAIFFGLVFNACLGEDPFEKQRQSDSATIKAYVAAKKLQGIFTTSGLYYDTISLDTVRKSITPKINPSSIVEISYRLFDLSSPKEILLTSSKSYTFQPQIGSFFSGLSEGILLTRKGQTSIFILPSLLALGSQTRTVGGVVIPGNSCLRLEVKVLDVRDASLQETYENQLIKGYISQNKLTITKDSASVIFVRTKTNATGEKISIGDNLVIGYVGRLIDDKQFDKNAAFTVNLDLNNLIRGFVVGLTMMKTDETGLIFVTSSQGYGAKGSSGVIPPYAPLIFEITSLKKQ
jgi:FKBP-type peptidyl-prolyl cis-trans isomerase